MPRLPLLKHPLLHYRSKWAYHRCKHAPTPQGRVVREMNGIKLVFDFEHGTAIKRMYFDAYETDIIRIMRKYLKTGGIFIDIGAYIGYPKSSSSHDVIRAIPLDRIVVETDCPFLPPQSYRDKRNEPSYLPITVRALARIRGISPETIAEETTQNARRLFWLK